MQRQRILSARLKTLISALLNVRMRRYELVQLAQSEEMPVVVVR